MNKPPVTDYHLVTNHDVDVFNKECSRYVGMGYTPYKRPQVKAVNIGFRVLVYSQSFVLPAITFQSEVSTK